MKLFKGALALVIRQILLSISGALALAGVITATAGQGYYCFDVKIVSDYVADAVLLFVLSGASAGGSLVWRVWAKKRDGVT